MKVHASVVIKYAPKRLITQTARKRTAPHQNGTGMVSGFFINRLVRDQTSVKKDPGNMPSWHKIPNKEVSHLQKVQREATR